MAGGTVFPYPGSTTYTTGSGITLVGSAITWAPNGLTTKAIPLGTDFLGGYDVAGAANAKFLVSALPLSTAATNALVLKQTIGVYASLVTDAASRVLALTDVGAYLRQATGAAAIVYTVPLNSAVAFPIGTQIDGVRGSTANDLSFVASGGVTINSVSGFLKAAAQFAGWSLTKTATDTWDLVGNLKA